MAGRPDPDWEAAIGDWLVRWERPIGGLLVLAPLLIMSIVASSANGQMAFLLAATTCGQITDLELLHGLRAMASGAWYLSLAAVVLVAIRVWRGRTIPFFVLVTFASAITYVVAAIVFFRNRAHLTDCDIFFGGSFVLPVNYGLALVFSAFAMQAILTGSGLQRFMR